MEIVATGKLKYKDDGYTERLRLHVKFKLPNKILPVRKVKLLTSTSWIDMENGYDSYLDFQESTIKWINNKEYLSEVVRQVVLDYIKSKYINNKETDNLVNIKKLLKESNEIKVSVKVE